MCFISVLTVGGDPDDGKDDLIFRCVLVVDAERRVGDDDSRVFLHMDAANGNPELCVHLGLQGEVESIEIMKKYG